MSSSATMILQIFVATAVVYAIVADAVEQVTIIGSPVNKRFRVETIDRQLSENSGTSSSESFGYL